MIWKLSVIFIPGCSWFNSWSMVHCNNMTGRSCLNCHIIAANLWLRIKPILNVISTLSCQLLSYDWDYLSLYRQVSATQYTKSQLEKFNSNLPALSPFSYLYIGPGCSTTWQFVYVRTVIWLRFTIGHELNRKRWPGP